MERFGWVGVLRGVMGASGSTDEILHTVIRKRAADYGRLLLPVSRDMAAERYRVTLNILSGVERALQKRDEDLAAGLPIPRQAPAEEGQAAS